MMLKALFVLALAVGALADNSVIEEHREQIKNALRDYCKKNGASDEDANTVQAAVQTFSQCVQQLVNPADLKKEIDEAMPKGALDEVFQKYCARGDQFKACISSLSTAVMPCLPARARQQVGPAAITNATSQLIDFACFKDGDRIAMFIAEKGPECIQSKVNEIRTCADTVKNSISSQEAEGLTVEQACGKYKTMSQCVVTALEGCDSPTPANMVEAVFRFMKNGSPCKDK